MSQSSPPGSTQVSPGPAAPMFHTDNIFASPATSLLGVGWIFNTVGNQLAAGVPANTSGWIGLAVNTLIGLAGMLGRA